MWIYTVFQVPAYHSIESLYISYPISWIVTFAAELIAFILVYRKRCRQMLDTAHERRS